MKLDLQTWGPLTVLAVAAVLLIIVGGLVEVVVADSYTFRAFLDDLKYVAAALAGGAAIGRGIRLNGPTERSNRVGH